MDKKNVFLVFQTPDYGGTRTFFFQLAQYLLERNYQIHLLVKTSEFTGIVPDFCKDKNIIVYRFDEEIKLMPLDSFRDFKTTLLITYNYLKQIFYLRKIHKKIRPEFTIVSQGWPFIWTKALYLPGKIYFVQHVMPLNPLDKGNLLLFKVGLLRKKCTFVSVSNFCRNKICEYWIGKYPKIEIIYNYYEQPKKYLKITDSTDITILAIARVEDGKNPLLWIEMAKEVVNIRHNIRFIWAGDGTLLDEARKLTADTPNIKFIGFQSNVDELYARADIYFEPSKRESHGISVVGALAHGVPAIATSYGGTVETVIDGYNGYIVDVSNKTQMIDRLLKLIDDKELRTEMGCKGYQRWEEMFTRKIWEEKMDKLLSGSKKS